MHSSPRQTLLKPEILQGARVIRLLDREDTRYPILMRLCLDFGFKVLQLHPKVFSIIRCQWVPGNNEYVLAMQQAASQPGEKSRWFAMTPQFLSLKELDTYAQQYQVDILHDYLFGDGHNQGVA